MSDISDVRLGVNIDHVATVRNARGGRHPDPVRAAEIAIAAGADVYRYTYDCQSGLGKCSVYPWSAVTSSNAACI